MVGPRFAALVEPNDAGSALLRQRMLRFMIVMAKDEEMRAPLAESAAARIGLDGEPNVDAAPASELETIFSVGVQDIGEPFFELLLEQAIASEDPQFRQSATGALARVEDPLLVARLQDALMAQSFKGTEALRIMFRQMVRTATTELTYAWIVDNQAEIIEMIPAAFRSRVLPGLGGSFCSHDRADEWEAFVVSNAEAIPGYERTLAQSLESVRLCAGLKEAKAGELLAALEGFDNVNTGVNRNSWACWTPKVCWVLLCPRTFRSDQTGGALEQRVDKRGERRSLREYNQTAEQKHDDDYRGKPELLSLPHEGPEVGQEIQHQKGFSSFSCGLLML
jgi:hypothetical protein